VPTVANTFPTNTELVPNHYSRRGELLEFCAADFRRCVSARYAEQMRHPRRQRLCGRPEHVYGAAVDRVPLEPRIRLATLHRYGPQAVAGINHGLDVATIKRPDKAALAHLTGSILASLQNHKGNGIERTNEGAPARWRLKEAAD
jgi:hypothetical protein